MPEERTGQLAMGRQTRSRASDEDDLVGERQRLVGWGRHKTRRVHARACVDCVFRQAGRQRKQETGVFSDCGYLTVWYLHE